MKIQSTSDFWELITSYIQSKISLDKVDLIDLAFSWTGALLILIVGFILARVVYNYTLRVFKKYKLKDKIDQFEDFLESDDEIRENPGPQIITKKLTERIKVDVVVAKSFSYYIFLLSFRIALEVVGIDEVASSLNTLLQYLPSLFIWIVIWFFWIRFSNFIYDVTYHTLSIAEAKSQNKTSKIIATGSKWLILFLTFTLVLNFTKIVPDDFIKIILVWFVWMVALAGWLAFGLWWKEMAGNILRKFNSDDGEWGSKKEEKKDTSKKDKKKKKK